MKYLILLLPFIIGCGAQGYLVQAISNSCTSTKVGHKTTVSCTDGSTSTIEDGHSVVFSTLSASSCTNGGSTILMASDVNDNGVLDITDEHLQSVIICNGENAQANGFTPVAIIDPCGDYPGKYDEVFLRLANGTLLASFSDSASGQNTRFSVLTSGSYVTTDGTNCYFTVDASGNLINEHY